MPNMSNRHEKFVQLRKELPVFTYESYDFSCSEHGLDIRFHFNLADKYHFYPQTFIPQKNFFPPVEELTNFLPILVFHIGLIELISYWKAACPPLTIIKPHPLSVEQISWWKKVWFNGLGEFFYVNSIATDPCSFMKVDVASDQELPLISRDFQPEMIIPVGGGKDSIVTLELAAKQRGTIPLILNPRGASVHSIFTAGFAHSGMFGIHRSIDPLLLKLNDLGFLNGHTPFSALLAFLSLLAAVISGKKYIALSNESSANEPTIPGQEINHQYSKTFKFESDFRQYIARFICTDVNYFSFLRPLNEIQIARLFSRYPQYFPVFKSCNVGSKNDTWCGKCPKCLFTYIMLAPFLKPEELFAVFKKNLFQDDTLKPVFDQLTGLTPEKPFDCVGTIGEVNAALTEIISRYGNEPLPTLLHNYSELTNSFPVPPGAFTSFLAAWDSNNFLPTPFETLLKGVIYA